MGPHGATQGHTGGTRGGQEAERAKGKAQMRAFTLVFWEGMVEAV